VQLPGGCAALMGGEDGEIGPTTPGTEPVGPGTGREGAGIGIWAEAGTTAPRAAASTAAGAKCLVSTRAGYARR
jgi:hypothetical protein